MDQEKVKQVYMFNNVKVVLEGTQDEIYNFLGLLGVGQSEMNNDTSLNPVVNEWKPPFKTQIKKE